ncbi:MAG: D-alanyl-D-alanine carboxypeptidase/D-alanyl-D-alanine-endopeptidase [Burkholderiaceae bacterium]|jgi:D-alanyl-D-alanine carboxypeptidase/D-alanyl-D-alanine-endopeptidase (penicillin-binding protein 4)|nr:D-alanyl-D-alanine carboxypeptidase/D-alanyl-D-alanine-endopeptidase [Burkholderiaceae bacterium]
MNLQRGAAAFLKRLLMLFTLCALPLFYYHASAGPQESHALPGAVARELKKAKVPASAVGLYIQPLSAQSKLRPVRFNDKTPYIPASTMKVVTTWTALEILGPAHHWKTSAWTSGQQDGDVLKGDLIFKGGGDPDFRLVGFWRFLRQIRAKGIREIQGDLVLDRSAFEARPFDPAAFDNDPSRPYNAGPDALLLNHKTLEATFTPNPLDGVVQVRFSPELEGIAIIPPTLKDNGACNAWQKAITLHFSEKEAIFEGAYPLACGEQTWMLYPYPMSDSAFFGAVFAALWKELGGSFSGKVREGVTPPDASLLAEWISPPLNEIVHTLNKHSNNVMARHVLMAIGSTYLGDPATPEKGVAAIRSFLSSQGIPIEGLVIENGSGLSREARISPDTMGGILVAAWHSAVMPELMASLPIAGRDGTLARSMRQSSMAGRAHLKTGAIQDVRAIAGYVLAASGERYAVVFMVNHPNAGAAARARDALLTWLHDKG